LDALADPFYGSLAANNPKRYRVPQIGLAALIHPLSLEDGLVTMDIPLLFVLSFIVLVFLLRRKGLQKYEAVLLILFYGIYISSKFLGY